MANDTRLGILAFATMNGLGYQTRALYKNLKPDKVMLCDISNLNGQKVYEDWYNFDIRTNGFPTESEIDSFLDGLDVVFVCETPLKYYLFDRANQLGIKTILQVNPEFCDYFSHRELPKPTVFALPTLWMVDKFVPQTFTELVHLPVPVDTNELPKRHIIQAKTFFHVAGRPAVHDRNGTLEFIKAVKMIQNDIDADFIIYMQVIDEDILQALDGTRIEVKAAVEPADMYKDGDILVMPRKYGGLCLPAQEAVGSGIPVIMPDIDPNNRWLPKDWLVEVSGMFTFFTRSNIDAYNINLEALADKMMRLYALPELVSHMASEARKMSQMMSWDSQLVRYKTMIEELSCISA